MLAKEQKFYQALIDKNSDYEGIFFIVVKTAGVFCRPTCPARKPNLENNDGVINLKFQDISISNKRKDESPETLK